MNILDILRELNIPHRQAGESPHVSQGWIGVICPFCGMGTTNYGMGINLVYQSCTCWKCGRHSLTSALTELSGRPWQEIKNLLGQVEHERIRQEPTHGKLKLPDGIGPLLPVHERYLRGRGFDPDHLTTTWNIQGIGLASKLAWRLFIPITSHGETVSWTTRASTDDTDRRYRNARPEEEATPAKSLLYGSDKTKHAVIVVEGPTDCWRIGPGSVCTFGLSYSRAQMVKISRFPVRVITFDNEPQAQQTAEKLCRELSAYPGRTVRVELDADDPGSASAKEVRLLRRSFLE